MHGCCDEYCEGEGEEGIRSGVVNHQNLGIRDGVSAAGNKGWGNTPLVPGDKHVHM